MCLLATPLRDVFEAQRLSGANVNNGQAVDNHKVLGVMQ
jgi:hypothetical protein